MSNQQDKLGSEAHKRLMRRMIAMLQGRIALAIVGREKCSFDILEIS